MLDINALNEISKENLPTATFKLADLTMMQMAGDFSAFEESLPKEFGDHDFTDSYSLIKTTLEEVTSPKLFKNAVTETTELQTGDTVCSS